MINEQAKLTEINQRMTRMESRLVQLGDHVGANLRTKLQIELKNDEHGEWVEVDARDVSISRILTSLRQSDVKIGTQLKVKCKGQTIATVFAE